jgi:RNA polymerase sigma-70 factor, ECF subfamily
MAAMELHSTRPRRPRDPTTADWPRRARTIDQPAAEQLLLAVRPTMVRVVTSVLGASHPDFDDALQQCSLALLKAASAFRGECHPAGYAGRIAFRVALRMRHKCRREWSRRGSIEGYLFANDSSTSPHQLVEANETREALRGLVASLPAVQLEALTLRAVLDWSLDEVACAMGVPSNTVRSRMRLARQTLKRGIAQAPRLAEALDTRSARSMTSSHSKSSRAQ